MKKIRLLCRLLRNTGADKVIYSFLGFVEVSALVIWLREPEIHTYPEALWYCFTAISTIGFGDVVVHSPLSRALTVLISIYGVIALAIFTAVVVNYFQEVIAAGRREQLEEFMRKAERLPELSREELEEMAAQAREWRK